MILPDGYSDIPAGKIAAIVTHLEMTARPPRRDDPPGGGQADRLHLRRPAQGQDMGRRRGAAEGHQRGRQDDRRYLVAGRGRRVLRLLHRAYPVRVNAPGCPLPGSPPPAANRPAHGP